MIPQFAAGGLTRFRHWLIAAPLLLLSVGTLSAQATTIQLPTFNFFTVNTTVEVPDGGSGFIGGLSSNATGQTQRGIPGLGFVPPLGNRATGATGSASGMSVTATIHDFDAMDRALLGSDFDRSGHYTGGDASAGGDPALRQRLARLPVMLRPLPPSAAESSRPSQLAADTSGSQSIAAMRAQQSAEDSAQQAEAAQLLAQAREVEAAGKPGVAKIYYQMAARRATGSLKNEALAELQRLGTTAQSSGR